MGVVKSLTCVRGLVQPTPGYGTVDTADITAKAVTYAKIQDVTSLRLLGRTTVGAGTVEEIQVGSGLSFSGGVLNCTTAPGHAMLSATHTDTVAATCHQGDLIIGGSGLTWVRKTIGNANFTFISDGSNPNWTQFNLLTHSTGTLTIARGGTGQTTAAAAYAALSPETTKGDLTAYSTTPVRLAVGSNGQVLTADSTQATGLAWSTPATAPPQQTEVGCRVANSTDISCLTGAWTLLTFDTESYDVGGCHDTATNPGRITCPSGKAGYWSGAVCIRWQDAVGGVRGVRVRVNGGPVIAQQSWSVATIPLGDTDIIVLCCPWDYHLAAGDYVTAEAYQDGAASLAVRATDDYSPRFWGGLRGV